MGGLVRTQHVCIYVCVICIINLQNTLFKGFTRGDPWASSLVKQNLNRTSKYKVIALKKIKKTF
jgi:hypothetical protein